MLAADWHSATEESAEVSAERSTEWGQAHFDDGIRTRDLVLGKNAFYS